MSIKPVDFQVMLPRAPEVSKAVSDEQHKNQAFHQQQMDSMQSKADSNLRQVHSRENAQQARISEKQKKDSEGNRKKNKEENDDSSSEKNSSKKNTIVKTTTIDIRL